MKSLHWHKESGSLVTSVFLLQNSQDVCSNPSISIFQIPWFPEALPTVSDYWSFQEAKTIKKTMTAVQQQHDPVVCSSSPLCPACPDALFILQTHVCMYIIDLLWHILILFFCFSWGFAQSYKFLTPWFHWGKSNSTSVIPFQELTS